MNTTFPFVKDVTCSDILHRYFRKCESDITARHRRVCEDGECQVSASSVHQQFSYNFLAGLICQEYEPQGSALGVEENRIYHLGKISYQLVITLQQTSAKNVSYSHKSNLFSLVSVHI